MQRAPFIEDPFPMLKVNTTVGELTLPDAFHGRWFVLFSHPGDFTPVCTTEFVAFQKLKPDFERLNTQLIGLSVEQVFSHLKWLEWIHQRLGVDITFPLIADPLGKTAGQLGMIHPTQGTRTVRSVFIVDPLGTIRTILTYPQEIGRNTYEILRIVQALQTSDAAKGFTPANWPKNEIIGNKLLVPPPQTVQEAAERKRKALAEKLDCYDWWFCTR
ncbi:peroxiredoxin [Alicyclobacillus ferrooxydans]|uniref:Peroxiredoxin n=1 Tax=Alicyclobacillus ferrooxydans TaxID=471514 RepID=A0A0P9CJD4_9BACL|nr:peroxiredoxin [Alicyclobacillus ferrooxydans]